MENIRERNFSEEWFFRTSRSSGKGGQNVNKVSTKVEICFYPEHSLLLTTEEKELIMQKLHTKISSEGLLRVSSEKERSQLLNKKTAIEKFYRLIEKALELPEERIPTKPTKASVKKRQVEKVQQSEKKQRRKRPLSDLPH